MAEESPTTTRYPFSITIVIPAYNEQESIAHVLAAVAAQLPEAELLVVNDASQDDTAKCALAAGARVVTHAINKGNGAAVKTGIREAHGDVVLLMDADGQMDTAYIPLILDKMADGFDMVVGARTAETQGDTLARRPAAAGRSRASRCSRGRRAPRTA